MDPKLLDQIRHALLIEHRGQVVRVAVGDGLLHQDLQGVHYYVLAGNHPMR